MTGEELFNEVFLDGVFVPDDLVVGEVGQGWKVARNTLSNERVSLSSGSGGTGSAVSDLVGLAGGLGRELDPGGAPGAGAGGLRGPVDRRCSASGSR